MDPCISSLDALLCMYPVLVLLKLYVVCVKTKSKDRESQGALETAESQQEEREKLCSHYCQKQLSAAPYLFCLDTFFR